MRAVRNQRSLVSKKVFYLALIVLLFARYSSAQAQQTAKAPRIGYLSVLSLSAMRDRSEAFRQGLRELGYMDGKNIVIEWRYGEEKPERVNDLAIELARLKIDAIVTGGNSATEAAKKATSTIPIVMTQASDPVASGFVASLARLAESSLAYQGLPRR